ncbi:BsuPI-related putative proteinase inhibitor [Pseudoneobacillus sp. C159]
MKKILLVLFFVTSLPLVSNVQAETNPESQFRFYINPVPDPEETVIEIFLANEGNQILEFEAPTSQWFDFTVTNQDEEIVYHYSHGRSFLQAFQKLILRPGETKKWSVNLSEPHGQKLKPGKYLVKAQLKAISVNGEDLKGYHRLMDQKEMVIPEKNPIIKNVIIKLNGDRLEISGHAKPLRGELFFVVEDGHRELVKESMVKVPGKPSAWGAFFIKVDIPKGSDSFILYLYEKDKKGNMLHIYPKKVK